MKTIIKYITLSILIIACVSCRKVSPNITNPSDVIFVSDDKYWSDVFEVYWNGMNHNYVFWDIDTLNWDRIYRDYKPRFEGLTNNKEDDIKAVALFKEIVSPLIDYHYSLTLKQVDSTISQISPSDIQNKKRPYYHPFNDNFQKQFILNLISKMKDIKKFENYETIDANTLQTTFLASSFNYKDIACFHLSNFKLTTLLSEKDSLKVHKVITNFQEMAKSDQTKGIIIDLRHNGGGSVADVSFLFNPFVQKDEKITFCHTRLKKSMSRLDYMPLIPGSVIGKGDKNYNEKPIVVLVDLHSVSCSESTTLFCKEFFKDICVMGERTWGGQGMIWNQKLFAGGQFENSQMSVYSAGAALFTKDKTILESKGIDVDVEVLYDDASFSSGVDRQFDKAVEYLIKKF